MIENIAVERKAARSTGHWQVAIPAIGVFARFRGTRKIKLEVIGDEQIQMAVVIIVQERAAGVVPHPILCQAGLGRDVLEAAPSPVAIQHVRAPVGDKQIRVAVIVEIARADALPPTSMFQAHFLGDIREFAISQIVVQTICAPWS